MYARNIRRVISTDFVVVACCERVGSFLVQLWRDYAEEIIQNRYNINWGKIKKYNGD
jgi:hypothetical protein